LKRAAQVRGRRGEHEKPVRLGEIALIGHDAKVGRKDHAGEVSVVRTRVREPLSVLGCMGPEADGALRLGEQNG
jgi:hypothetical protein